MLRLSGAALVGLVATTGYAFALDPVTRSPWAGPYAGVSLGYVGSTGDLTRTGIANPDLFVALPPGGGGGATVPLETIISTVSPARVGIGSSSLIGGAHAGYAAQFGQFVLGAEVDFSLTGLRSSHASQSSYFDGVTTINVTLTSRSEMDWLGTARMRAGFTFDRAHIYATGGLAVGRVDHRVTYTSTNAFAPRIVSGAERDTKVGIAIGAGAEYALTDSLILRGEYLYYDLGKSSVAAVSTPPPGTQPLRIDYDFENRGHIGRLGLSYRF